MNLKMVFKDSFSFQLSELNIPNHLSILILKTIIFKLKKKKKPQMKSLLNLLFPKCVLICLIANPALVDELGV